MPFKDSADLNNDIAPLEEGFSYYIVQCEMGSSVILDESTLKKSPYLAAILNADTFTTEIILSGHYCHQETLYMATDFMKGNLMIWTQMTTLNVEDLTIMADYLQLQVLLDQCITWILRGMFFNGFKLSQSWMKRYPEHYQEVYTLFKSISDVDDIIFGKYPLLRVKINQTELFTKFDKVKRFSGLEVRVQGTVHPFFHQFNKSLRFKSLELGYQDQSQLAFLDKRISFPILKKLSLISANISNLTRLSIVLNGQKMPQLRELYLSGNSNIRLDTLTLDKPISLKLLNLKFCDLKDISPFANLIPKMPQLKELDLLGNRDIKLFDSFRFNSSVSLKRLNLGYCGLGTNDILSLESLLKQMPRLEELILEGNWKFPFEAFRLDTIPSLKRLNLRACGLTNMALICDILNNLPQLEDLDLYGNQIIKFGDSYQLSINNRLKRLNLGACGISNMLPLAKILPNMLYLEELNLSKNEFIKLHTFRLNTNISLKRLDLGICELRDVSQLADILYKMPELEELILFWNEHLQFHTFRLNETIPLKHLDVQYCGLTNMSPLSDLLEKMPNLKDLHY